MITIHTDDPRGKNSKPGALLLTNGDGFVTIVEPGDESYPYFLYVMSREDEKLFQYILDLSAQFPVDVQTAIKKLYREKKNPGIAGYGEEK